MGCCLGFGKPILRTVVLVAIAGTAFVAIAGKDKALALFQQARSNVTGVIDHMVGDPVALREQLKNLEAEYPKRIAQVRTDLTDLQSQKSELERELAISRRVVALAEQDLAQFGTLLGRAEATSAQHGHMAVVRIVHAGDRMSVDDAMARAEDIRRTREAYGQRVTDLDRDLVYLAEQEGRLAELLGKLESERAAFQDQLWQLDRQIDTIARNDRLIEAMEAREKTIEEQGRYKAASLDQVHARMAEIRAKQESQLASLQKKRERLNYEERAKLELESGAPLSGGATLRSLGVLPGPRVIEIAPPTVEINADDQCDGESDRSASRG